MSTNSVFLLAKQLKGDPKSPSTHLTVRKWKELVHRKNPGREAALQTLSSNGGVSDIVKLCATANDECFLSDALILLWNVLLYSSELLCEAVQAGGVEALGGIIKAALRAGHRESTLHALNAVLAMTKHPLTLSTGIRESGMIPSLVTLLDSDRDKAVKTKTVNILTALTKCRENLETTLHAGVLDRLLRLLSEDREGEICLNVLEALANLLTHKACGVMDRKQLKIVLEFLTPASQLRDSTILAVLVLRQMALANADYRYILRTMGAIPMLLDMIRTGEQADLDCTTCAVAALRALAIKSPGNRVVIREAHGIEKLVSLLHGDRSSECTREAVELLHDLAVNSLSNREALAHAGGIPVLVKLLSNSTNKGEEDMANTTSRVLYSLSMNNAEHKDAIREAGGIRELVELLQNGNEQATQNAAGALWSLSVDNTANKTAIRRAGAAESLAPLLFKRAPENRETIMQRVREWHVEQAREEKRKNRRSARGKPLYSTPGALMYDAPKLNIEQSGAKTPKVKDIPLFLLRFASK